MIARSDRGRPRGRRPRHHRAGALRRRGPAVRRGLAPGHRRPRPATLARTRRLTGALDPPPNDPGHDRGRSVSAGSVARAWRGAATDQPLAALSSAFCARLPAWYAASASAESTSPSVGCVGITASRPGSSSAQPLAQDGDDRGGLHRRRCPAAQAADAAGPRRPSPRSRPGSRRCRSPRRSPRTGPGPCRPSRPGSGAGPVARGRPSSSSAGSMARDPRGVQVAEPALQLGGSAERLLDGHLLVEREADEQGERVADEQPVGVVVAGERQSIDRGSHGRHGTARQATADRTSGPATLGGVTDPVLIHAAHLLDVHAGTWLDDRRLLVAATAGSPTSWPRTRRRQPTAPDAGSARRLGHPGPHRLPQPPGRRPGGLGGPGDRRRPRRRRC